MPFSSQLWPGVAPQQTPAEVQLGRGQARHQREYSTCWGP